MAFSLGMIWILQLAPETPKLAPVFNPLTHMVPPPFPLLLVVPALAIDLVMQRVGPGRDWWLSALVGLAFWAAFFVAQWFLTALLLTPPARHSLSGIDACARASGPGPCRAPPRPSRYPSPATRRSIAQPCGS